MTTKISTLLHVSHIRPAHQKFVCMMKKWLVMKNTREDKMLTGFHRMNLCAQCVVMSPTVKLFIGYDES